jgi:hypothetical protein
MRFSVWLFHANALLTQQDLDVDAAALQHLQNQHRTATVFLNIAVAFTTIMSYNARMSMAPRTTTHGAHNPRAPPPQETDAFMTLVCAPLMDQAHR